MIANLKRCLGLILYKESGKNLERSGYQALKTIMLIEKGWHMKDISEWLGHSDIGTTMNIYGHISMEHKRELGNSLSGLLDG